MNCYVIDNASKDNTVTLVKQRFPQVTLVCNTENTGYARAVNQGFAMCNTEYVMLLNPDIRINSPFVYSELLSHIRKSKSRAVAAPLQFKLNGGKCKLNFTWSYTTLNSFNVYLSHLFGFAKDFTDPIQVPFLNAGCLLIRRSAFEVVGRLNERYFMYGEEPDLFLKLMRFGYKCHLHPGISVIHYRERSVRATATRQRIALRFLSFENVIHALAVGCGNLLSDWVSFTLFRFVKKSVKRHQNIFDN